MDAHMDKGKKVWRGYYSDGAGMPVHWVDEGEVTDIIMNGEQLVRMRNMLVPLTGDWRVTIGEAKRDIHRKLVRFIGSLQAKADKLSDEILHDDLTTEEAAA